MPSAIAKSYNEQLMDIVEQYRDSGQKVPATKQEIACWAIENDLWTQQPQALITQCANDLAVAMRADKETDPQGRLTRTMAAARMTITDVDGKEKHQSLWDFAHTGTSEHIAASLVQRHRQIGGDCKSLYVDASSVNDNNPNFQSKPIQFSWDFTQYLNEDE